jgi:hypothetical protein
MAKEVMKSDISNKTVMIVLILVILASVVSLGVYFSVLETATPQITPIASGKVSLEIVEPPKVSEPVTEEGKVGVVIIPPPQ